MLAFTVGVIDVFVHILVFYGLYYFIWMSNIKEICGHHRGSKNAPKYEPNESLRNEINNIPKGKGVTETKAIKRNIFRGNSHSSKNVVRYESNLFSFP